MAKKATCSFNQDWLNKSLNPQFSSWIKQVPTNKNQAHCILCLKNFELSTMGRSSVMSHLKGSTHIRNSSAVNANQHINTMISKKVSDSEPQEATSTEEPVKNLNVSGAAATALSLEVPAIVPSTSAVSTTMRIAGNTMNNHLTNSAVTDSEIIWCLKVVMNHLSFNSCKDLGNTFQTMFPDSDIARKFTLSPAKVAYTIVHGLAPYFSDNLQKSLQDCTFVVVCFDEALNKIAQRGQMDIVVRFWDDCGNIVVTRYLTSVFLGHATAKDLEEKFKQGLAGVNLHKVVQISMDGPSVNWKFLESFSANTRPDASDPKLFDLGSCGLHVVHGAFQSGHRAAGWTVSEMLRSMYGLFKDSPARRADYTAETGSTCFPKKFCQVRWLGNAEVAARAIEIFPHVKKYVDKTKKLPNNFTCNNITAACADPLVLAKLSFFASISAIFEPFLKKYQTSEPMMAFMHDDVAHMLRCLLQRFVKKSILQDADTSNKLIKVDLASKDTLMSYKDVDIGVGAVKWLATSKSSDLAKMEFRMQCITFMKAAATKIIERSPLKYSMVRSFSCLAPQNIVHSRTTSEKRMSDLLQKLYEGNQISSVVADRAKIQYVSLCSHASSDLREAFEGYAVQNVRLDAFYHKLIGGQAEYADLFVVVKFVMILSHGNASVESGFSVNGDMLVENQHEESLVAQRQIYDGVRNLGGLLKVKIDKRMQQYARGAHSRYQAAMQAKKAVHLEEQQKVAARKRVAESIKVLKEKKAKLTAESATLSRNIDIEIAELEKERH